MPELRTPLGHILHLPDGPVSVGTDPACEVPVAPHFGLAPLHFRLQPWEGGHFIEDAGSGLGTLVNGQAVNWKPLTEGDIIIAGELEIIYSQQVGFATVTDTASAAVEAYALRATSPAPAALPPLPAELPVGILLPAPLPAPLTPPILTRSTARQMPALAHPPAWLPEDLLPESYRVPPQPQELTVDSSAASQPLPAPVVSSGEKDPFSVHGKGLFPPPAPVAPSTIPPLKSRAGRLLFPAAAALALLGWAGHEAWQRGHLDGLLRSFTGGDGASLPQPENTRPPPSDPPDSTPAVTPLSADRQALKPLTH